eukprot:TRINITY_DN2865_c0_g2_i1.p1 TRINITY_DN2865_c0_g2~~TRINITY_DN2865_c0_g2_i1.p1  ORF type:complete len:276 (-),score=52.68 TRINITY_DN2865_c0_g2_i1:80-907(-)
MGSIRIAISIKSLITHIIVSNGVSVNRFKTKSSLLLRNPQLFLHNLCNKICDLVPDNSSIELTILFEGEVDDNLNIVHSELLDGFSYKGSYRNFPLGDLKKEFEKYPNCPRIQDLQVCTSQPVAIALGVLEFAELPFMVIGVTKDKPSLCVVDKLENGKIEIYSQQHYLDEKIGAVPVSISKILQLSDLESTKKSKNSKGLYLTRAVQQCRETLLQRYKESFNWQPKTVVVVGRKALHVGTQEEERILEVNQNHIILNGLLQLRTISPSIKHNHK